MSSVSRAAARAKRSSATVLQTRDALDLVAPDLDALCAALAARAREHRDTVMAGRTHLQHALPVTFGYKCAVWLAPLLTMRERLAQLRPRTLKLQFGGAAGTLASLGARGSEVAAALARELDLGEPEITWHVARDGLAEAVCWLGLLCGALSKIATDVILLPYFLSPGVHVAEDLTEARDKLGERFPGVRFVLAEPLGRHPLLVDVVEQRAREVEGPGERGA